MKDGAAGLLPCLLAHRLNTRHRIVFRPTIRNTFFAPLGFFFEKPVTVFPLAALTSERAVKLENKKTKKRKKNEKVIVSMVIAMVAIAGIPSITQAQGVGAYASFRVNGHATNSHREYLNAGHIHIAISGGGGGDTDLDMYVYDSFGNLIYSGTGRSDDKAACLTINRSGGFTVQVQNCGHAYNI